MISRSPVAFAAFAATVAAHGNLLSPPERTPGPAMAAACGQGAVDTALADPTTPLENIDISGATTACQLDVCRGARFEDNTANVQQYSPGDTVRIQAALPIPHAGPMNVSLIDLSTNTAVAPALIFDPNYADETLPQLPANNTDFSVVMPQLADGQCAQAGQCTMQWFWFGTRAQQTYESCVDFVMVASGATAGSGQARVAPAAQAVPAGASTSGATSGTVGGVSFVFRGRKFKA